MDTKKEELLNEENLENVSGGRFIRKPVYHPGKDDEEELAEKSLHMTKDAKLHKKTITQ